VSAVQIVCLPASRTWARWTAATNWELATWTGTAQESFVERCTKTLICSLSMMPRSSLQSLRCSHPLIVSDHYRQDAAKRQTAGIVFTHRPKIRFFVLVAPIQVILCRTDGHLGPLGCAKFHINRCRWVGMRPPNYQKFPLFGKESPRFPKFLGAFIRLTILR